MMKKKSNIFILFDDDNCWSNSIFRFGNVFLDDMIWWKIKQKWGQFCLFLYLCFSAIYTQTDQKTVYIFHLKNWLVSICLKFNVIYAYVCNHKGWLVILNNFLSSSSSSLRNFLETILFLSNKFSLYFPWFFVCCLSCLFVCSVRFGCLFVCFYYYHHQQQ